MKHKIIIGADLVPTKSNVNLFIEGNIKTLIGDELDSLLKSADFTIFNLEVPLSDTETPIDKCGPNLIAPTSTINGIKKINPNFFTLANNHIMDQGEDGLFSTMSLLSKNGIVFSGVGRNLEEASKPYIHEFEDLKIGIYCCVEHEFSIAEREKSGANPFDPFESLGHINSLSKKCDYTIVLYHGGKEHYRYPSPYLQKVCHKIIENGANLVVCQHSHCIGCMESWLDGNIIYGQGNFLFDMRSNEYWNTGLLLELNFLEGQIKPNISYVPIEKQGETVRLSSYMKAEQILNQFKERSNNILSEKFLNLEYERFSQQNILDYLRIFYGHTTNNLLVRIFNRLLQKKFIPFMLKRNYSTKIKLAILNYIECEAHRELLIQGLKKQINEEMSENE